MITLIKKLPGKDPEVINVEDNLKNYQDIVGGHLEVVIIQDLKIYKLDLFCNDDWRNLGLDPNLYSNEINYDGLIGGPVFIISHNSRGDAIRLQEYQIKAADRWLREHAITHLERDES